MHGAFRPTRVLAAAPLTSRHCHETCNLKWHGTFFGASRLWLGENVALTLRSQTSLGPRTGMQRPSVRPLRVINPDHAI